MPEERTVSGAMRIDATEPSGHQQRADEGYGGPVDCPADRVAAGGKRSIASKSVANCFSPTASCMPWNDRLAQAPVVHPYAILLHRPQIASPIRAIAAPSDVRPEGRGHSANPRGQHGRQ